MPEQPTATKKKHSLILIMSFIFLAVVIIGALMFFAIPHLFPAPLSLPAGTDLVGRLVIEDTRPFHVGDRIPVTLEIEARDGIKFQMPDLSAVPLGPLELKEHDSRPESTRLRGGQKQQLRLLLTSWEVGEHPFPALTVEYRTGAGKRMTAEIPSRTIAIRSLLPAHKTEAELLKLDIKAPKEPMDLPPRYERLWWFGAALLLVGLTVLMVTLWRRYRREKEALITPETRAIEPAHLVAFRRLDALKQAGYLEQGDFKSYYSELSECVREYMENRFRIRALEMTTEEFLSYLATNENAQLRLEFQAILREFLHSSDLIKFAKHLPAIRDAEDSYQLVRDLIEKTKEAEPEAQSLTANGRKDLRE